MKHFLLSGYNENWTDPKVLVRHFLSFQKPDTPTVFDDLVEFITKTVEPLYIPWLHSRKEEDTLITANHGTDAADDDSDEEQLPDIQEMHQKKRRMEEDTMVVKTDTVNLQCAGDSAVNLSNANNSTLSLGGNSNSGVKKPGINNSPTNMTGMCDDDVAKVQANDNSTVNSQSNKNTQVKADTNVTNPSGRRKRKRRARRSSKTNQNNVSLAYLRPCVKSFDIGKDKGNRGK